MGEERVILCSERESQRSRFWSWCCWSWSKRGSGKVSGRGRGRGEVGLVRMTLWQLLEAILMITNALAILNEDRFLAPNGWGFGEMGSGRVTTIKGQIVGLLHAVQYLRVPLVALNSIVIVMKVIFG